MTKGCAGLGGIQEPPLALGNPGPVVDAVVAAATPGPLGLDLVIPESETVLAREWSRRAAIR